MEFRTGTDLFCLTEKLLFINPKFWNIDVYAENKTKNKQTKLVSNVLIFLITRGKEAKYQS